MHPGKEFSFVLYGCSLVFFVDEKKPKEVLLDQFNNFKGGKGDGQKALCKALMWFQKNKPEIELVCLSSVPCSQKSKQKGITRNNAQILLNNYYKSLGFQETRPNSNDFIAPIQKLIKKCQGESVPEDSGYYYPIAENNNNDGVIFEYATNSNNNNNTNKTATNGGKRKSGTRRKSRRNKTIQTLRKFF
jgi:hypothetical protein